MRIFLFLLFVSSLNAATITYNSLPYRSKADSPFYAFIWHGGVSVEDFEDGLLNTPGLSLPFGRVSTTGRNSVDEDDGSLDNLGVGFHWLGTGNLLPGETIYSTEIRFSMNSEGLFPRSAGLVMLGFEPSDLGLNRYFQAFDENGFAIPEGFMSSAIPVYPGISSSISTVGDRFFGLQYVGGISKILVGGTGRLDHIQFGYGSIPEPGSAVLALWAGLHFFTRRKRTHSPR